MKKVTNRGKRSKTLNEVKPVENINISPQSLQEKHFLQREILSLHFKSFVQAFNRIGEP